MDGCSSKRNRNGIVVPRKEYNLVLRDKIDTNDENAQFCNRIGCSGRLKYTKSSPDGAEKPKYSRPSIHSSNGKEIVGSSPRTCFPITSARSSPQDSPRKFSSLLESHSSKCSGVRGERDITKLISTRGKNHQTQPQPKMRASGGVKVTSTDVGSSCVGSKDMYKKAPCQKPQSGCENVLTGSSTDSNSSSLSSSSDASVSLGSATRNNRSGNRYGLRNLKCNSISDVNPRGGSPSETKNRRDTFRKRIPEGESSSFLKGNRGSVAPSKDKHGFHSISGISITSSRPNRNWALNHDTTSSVMTRRSLNADTKITTLNRGGGITASVTEFQSVSPRSPRPEMHNNGHHASSYLSSMGDSSNASSSYILSEQTGDNVPGIVTVTSTEHGVTQGLRQHNLSGASEVLLALERIEQDEELTYEQLLLVENNLFFGNLYFYDQHRDMRLDIDNMSYEELLALGDRMGTVSTALSEEALTKCVKRTIYQTSSLEVGCGGCSEDEADIKCSICQEEYAIGDEVGKLGCEHGYHVACLQQWLRLKNWCPVCKASAAP